MYSREKDNNNNGSILRGRRGMERNVERKERKEEKRREEGRRL